MDMEPALMITKLMDELCLDTKILIDYVYQNHPNFIDAPT